MTRERERGISIHCDIDHEPHTHIKLCHIGIGPSHNNPEIMYVQ